MTELFDPNGRFIIGLEKDLAEEAPEPRDDTSAGRSGGSVLPVGRSGWSVVGWIPSFRYGPLHLRRNVDREQLNSCRPELKPRALDDGKVIITMNWFVGTSALFGSVLAPGSTARSP